MIRGRLTLGVLVACPRDPEALQEQLEEAMATVGMSRRHRDRCRSRQRPTLSTHAVVVLGSPGHGARRSAPCPASLRTQGANIDSIRGVADYPVTGLELLVSAADTGADADAELRTGLAEVAVARPASTSRSSGPDWPGAPSGSSCSTSTRPSIQGEVIEMLAARAGVEDEVRAVTEAAMRGEIDFDGVAAAARRHPCRPRRIRDRRGRRGYRADPRRPHHHPHAAPARLPLRCGVRRVPSGHRADRARTRTRLRAGQHSSR